MSTHYALLLIQAHAQTKVRDLTGHTQLVLSGLQQDVVTLQVPVDDVIPMDMVTPLSDIQCNRGENVEVGLVGLLVEECAFPKLRSQRS